MGWIVGFIILMIILGSLGPIGIGVGVVGIGLLLIAWISGMSIFVTLAKVCAVIIVIIVVGAILAFIADL